MTSAPGTGDARAEALTAFAVRALSTPAHSPREVPFTLAPASADASFRRYFRATLGTPHALAPQVSTLIAVDAPPPMENCRAFVHVASLLHAAGVHAPLVLAQDLERGFLLVSDLGNRTYLAALDAAGAHGLYLDALDALVRFQASSRADVLPPYDEALLRRELDLFPDWYIARHLRRTLASEERHALERVFGLVLANNLAQPCVFVHRDYHSRNLMVSDPNPGILDFQDALFGPITYDLASLYKDAYIAWSEERVSLLLKLTAEGKTAEKVAQPTA